MKTTTGPWDGIVIGSGMGGLSCAAALAKTGHRILVLEQHSRAGGLTQTFERDGFSWDVGVHYIGEVDPGGVTRRVLDWLGDGSLEFASMGAVYDTVHFPGDFEFRFGHPKAVLRKDLAETFPGCEAQIDAFFDAVSAAVRAGRALFMRRALPGLAARFMGLWQDAEIERWWGRTTRQVLDELVSDPKLRAVLLTRQVDYGGVSTQSSFGMHAGLVHHYERGAHYPVGGGKAFADRLVPVIERAGGELRLRARVQQLVVEGGAVVGVRLADGSEIRAPKVLSDAGAHNTVARLLPPALRDSEWAHEILSFGSSVGHVALYLGLEGDIRAHGAGPSNHWFHESWDADASLWQDPANEPVPPSSLVSFPTLKDPRHDPGERLRHTAEVVALVPWAAFSRWHDSALGHRPADYAALKDVIACHLLAQFQRRFPALAPMVVCQELSTPLSTVAYTGAEQGAIYGVEATPRRFLSNALRARTPVPGLYLTGQDVVNDGVIGAMWGGVFAAATVDLRVWTHLD